jgi:hypothetical protein
MRKSIFVILGLFSLSTVGFSQTEIDSLAAWSSRFLEQKYADDAKISLNEQFIESFTEILENKKSFDQDFSALKSVSVQTASDKTLRIFTWFTITKSGYLCHGLVQTINPKIKNAVVTRLNDKGEDLRTAQFKVLNGKNWFGALYYDMVPFKIKGKKYYMVLGFNPGDGLSHKKVVDVVQVMNNGQPRFGAPLFEKDKKQASRIILEYDARAKITLRYIEDARMIVFDHLSPSRPELVNQYQYYIPDLSYDAFELTKNIWEFVPDVKPLNPDENLGTQGTRLVINGINDEQTLKDKMSEGTPDPNEKKQKEEKKD